MSLQDKQHKYSMMQQNQTAGFSPIAVASSPSIRNMTLQSVALHSYAAPKSAASAASRS